MQVISGAIAKEEIYFEAPPSTQVSAEMQLLVASISQHPEHCKFQFVDICFSPQLLI